MPKDPCLVPTDQRATGCTSMGLSNATSYLGACVPGWLVLGVELWPLMVTEGTVNFKFWIK